MLRCWPEFLSTIMSIFRHFQNFWWRSEHSHLGHHVSTKWCPFRSSRFLSRQLLIAVKAVFSCIMHSSVNEIYLLISRKQPSFNTWFYNLTLQKTPTAMNKYRHCSLAIGIVSFWRMGLTLPMFSDRAMDVEVDWKSIKASTRREGIWEASTAKWRLGNTYLVRSTHDQYSVSNFDTILANLLWASWDTDYYSDSPTSCEYLC